MISLLSTWSIALCTLMVCNLDRIQTYLLCVGRQEVFRSFPIYFLFYFYFSSSFCSIVAKTFLFRYNIADFYAGSEKGLEFKGPLWDPIRLLANLTTWNMFLVVPMFYCAIFKFRKAQNSTPGMMLAKTNPYSHVRHSKVRLVVFHILYSRTQWHWKEEEEGKQHFLNKDLFHWLASRGALFNQKVATNVKP